MTATIDMGKVEQFLGQVVVDAGAASNALLVYVGDRLGLWRALTELHDMADPVGAAVHARQALAHGGAVLPVEPFTHDRLEDNLNPVGRVYYAASTVFCTPASLNDDGAALGAQAGEQRLRSIFNEAGFSTFRRVAETPFNLVLEARL